MVTTFVYTSEELLKFLDAGDVKKPNFLVDLDQLHHEMKQFKKNRKKSHGHSESRRYSSFRKDRAALASTVAALGSDHEHDEAAVESNDESEDSDADINLNELSSRFYLQRASNNTRRNPKDVNPKFASAVANSLAVTGESAPTSSGTKHPHFRARRYSSKADRETVAAPVAAATESVAVEEDGWISVGPKAHNHPRKSFNHDEAGHRKRFNEHNRAGRGSFSKFGPSGGRKKSFASNKPTKAELTAALNGTGEYHFNKPTGSAVSSDESDDHKDSKVKTSANSFSGDSKTVKQTPEINVS